MNLKAKLAKLSTRGLSSPAGTSALSLSAESQTVEAPQKERIGQMEDAPGTRSLQLRARIDALRQAKVPSQLVGRPTSGWQQDVIETPHGPLCRILTAHAPDFLHGATRLAPCLSVTGAHLAALALDKSLEEVDCRRLLFVDTETTGLAGGAGCVPFLIGVGYFVDGALVIEQWMLRRLGEEAPMLARLAECLSEADAIVTYNGKSFDWPLLRNRFILNRVKMPAPRPHLDLLHCARRLFKRRVPEGKEVKRGGLKLSQVERDVLGFCRVGDIDGAHIPERYFAYLRGEPAALLDVVIEHNRHDLVSLAALLGFAGHKLDTPAKDATADEHLNLAHIAWRGQHALRAQAFAEHAVASSAAHIRGEAALLLGQMLLRQQKFMRAAEALRAGLGAPSPATLVRASLHLALAKLLEHRLRDVAGALVHAAHTHKAEGLEAQAKRMSRLQRKALSIASSATSARCGGPGMPQGSMTAPN